MDSKLIEKQVVAVVIPAFKVRSRVLEVIAGIGPEVAAIYVVDDGCPEGSGRFVEAECRDSRVRVLFHEQNGGVGAATVTGFRRALAEGADIIVKIDGDGQMDPALIPLLIRPIVAGDADYTKGNRFFYLEGLTQMPAVRLLGNSVLSFMAKFSSGYWHIFDPTNGYVAIHAVVAEKLPLEKVACRYFFESDMLFRLNTLRAVVLDIPMPARYGDEKSNLSVWRVIPEFAGKHARNMMKRIFYNYFLRDFSIASLELGFGAIFFLFGLIFGTCAWVKSVQSGFVASSGTVMLAALPTIMGFQMVLAFLAADAGNIPRLPLQKRAQGNRRAPTPP